MGCKGVFITRTCYHDGVSGHTVILGLKAHSSEVCVHIQSRTIKFESINKRKKLLVRVGMRGCVSCLSHFGSPLLKAKYMMTQIRSPEAVNNNIHLAIFL